MLLLELLVEVEGCMMLVLLLLALITTLDDGVIGTCVAKGIIMMVEAGRNDKGWI